MARSVESALKDYIVEAAPMVMILLDDRGAVLESNAYAQDLMGAIAPGTAMQGLLVEFAPPLDYAALVAEALAPVLLNVRTRDGMPESLYFQFENVEGGILALGHRNPGEEQILRREILTLNQDLGNTNRALQKSKVDLERLNELKNQFLGMAAHDLRKPLGVIMTYAEFLYEDLRSDLNEDHGEMLATIRSSTEFMRQLVDSFLDLAVIESGRLDLSLETTTMADIIRGAIALVSPAAKRREVAIKTDFGETALIAADHAKMEQVVMNLLANAIEYSPQGGTVWVAASTAPDTVTVSVRDEGPGVPPELRDRVFAAFATGFEDKRDGSGGTGLGLVIARKIVEAHGGRIWVEDTEDTGADFRFRIPLNYQ